MNYSSAESLCLMLLLLAQPLCPHSSLFLSFLFSSHPLFFCSFSSVSFLHCFFLSLFLSVYSLLLSFFLLLFCLILMPYTGIDINTHIETYSSPTQLLFNPTVESKPPAVKLRIPLSIVSSMFGQDIQINMSLYAEKGSLFLKEGHV